MKSIFSPPRAIYTGHDYGSKNNLLHLKPFVSYSSYFPVGLRSWRTARGLLRRPSMDLRHHASAFIIRRVQLVMLSLLWGIGPTPFSLRGSLCQQFATSFPATRGGGSIMTTYSPPSIGMVRILPTVFPLQNRLWLWSDADCPTRLIRWRIGWPRPRPQSWVRHLS